MQDIMKNNNKILYFFSLLIILQLTSSSCSHKSYPEPTTHKKTTVTSSKHNKTTNTSTKNTVAKSTTKPAITNNLSEIKTNNRELKHFLSTGYGKTLNIGNTSPDDIIKTARKYIGTPHRMGGTSLKGIDCSGLVMMAFADYGISLPHNSQEQARYGQVITDKYQLKPGDMVFFINTYKTSKYITHAGICIGNNQFIHTSSSKGVMVTSLDNSWWKDKFIFGTRVF